MDTESPDIIKGLVIEILRAVEGRELDILIVMCIAGIILTGWKKKFKSSAGFMVMISGVVMLRVLVQILFADELMLP